MGGKMKKILLGLALAFLIVCIKIKTTPYVTCQFHGQLGNHFFQVATAYSLAKDNGAKAIFPGLKKSKGGSRNRRYAFHRLEEGFLFQPHWKEYQEPLEYLTYHPIPYEP